MSRFFNEISMEVTDSDNLRYERLHLVIGYLYAINSGSVDMINAIKDEKGYLIIEWKEIPPLSLIDNCKNLWSSSLCKENPDNIEHYINGNRIYL